MEDSSTSECNSNKIAATGATLVSAVMWVNINHDTLSKKCRLVRLDGRDQARVGAVTACRPQKCLQPAVHSCRLGAESNLQRRGGYCRGRGWETMVMKSVVQRELVFGGVNALNERRTETPYSHLDDAANTKN